MNPNSNFQLGQYAHREYEAQIATYATDSDVPKVSIIKFVTLLGSVLTTTLFIAQIVTG